MQNFHIISMLPDAFPGILGMSLAGKALGKHWNYTVTNPRDFVERNYKSVDDEPFGGGIGQVMRPDILGKAIDNIKAKHNVQKFIYFSPRGKKINYEYIENLKSCSDILMLCGRYEGIDQRVIDFYEFEEVSLGDFIMSGGEIPAMTLIDACIRLIPGVINNGNALMEESFCSQNEFFGLLEYPLYTRPSSWNGLVVPEVLTSGDHRKIREWRLDEAKKITQKRRPDLWKNFKESKIIGCNEAKYE
ncbi:MAG: tRNA (guanosine(37)-N1)-methyltransferase TrmD [Alphaproteobacteria bacterium]|nr:tRNA (guanosine(37)-N1)-methyltransferase TrmD [Alphaproteobacteria bacterium]OJV15279.1 MAG: tRNA (guanosine(37)-N1)-methyltransferase TrmD [Alphaproteobacteria bacterium 33-17]